MVLFIYNWYICVDCSWAHMHEQKVTQKAETLLP